MTETDKTSVALIGNLEAYLPGVDEFECWQERFENFCDLNDLEEAKKKLAFLNYLGAEANNKLRTHIKPKTFKDITLALLLESAKKCFVVEKNVLNESFVFRSTNQKSGESYQDYALQLQNVAQHCKFDESLDRQLRDQFIYGIRSNNTREKILNQLAKDDTSFEDVVKKAKELQNIKDGANRMAKASDDDDNNNVHHINHERRSRNNDRKRAESNDMRSRRSPSRNRSRSNANVKCYKCQNWGHYANDCYSKTTQKFVKKKNYKKPSENINQVEESLGSMDICKSNSISINEVASDMNDDNEAKLVSIKIENVNVNFECDTGSAVTVMNIFDLSGNLQNLLHRIVDSELKLQVVSGDQLKVVGKVPITVSIRGTKVRLHLHIIETTKSFTPLLGRDWLAKLLPNWRDTFDINSLQFPNDVKTIPIKSKPKVEHKLSPKEAKTRVERIEHIKRHYSQLFDNNRNSTINVDPVEIHLKDENVKTFIHKPYTVPFNMREVCGKELDRLEGENTLSKAETAKVKVKVASPIVLVSNPKRKSIRIRMDAHRTINPLIESNHYPLPLIDELLVDKSEAKTFACIDLTGAYQQLRVSEKSKEILAVNTCKGLYVYNVLPFGVKPAASIFQSVMDQILMGIPNCVAYIDDILIWGKDNDELYETIKVVLDRLLQYNVKVNLSKCSWFVKTITYLGHVLSKEGITANPEGESNVRISTSCKCHSA